MDTAPVLAGSGAPLMRPRYDNSAIDSFTDWYVANKKALIAWWWKCECALIALGGEVSFVDASDFDQFCRVQHDLARRL